MGCLIRKSVEVRRPVAPPSPELHIAALRLLEWLAREHPLGYDPELEWARLRATAGQAFYLEGRIRLSVVLMTDAERLERTLLHEYAHLLAHARHGKRGMGHGTAWRQAMADLGEEPKVRHSYAIARNQPRQQVVYRCCRCGSALARKRRLPKRRKFVHANCGGSLRLESVSKRETA